jgi:hypothetical protein
MNRSVVQSGNESNESCGEKPMRAPGTPTAQKLNVYVVHT